MECSSSSLYQNSHVSIMRRIATSLCYTPMILKGGTALLLCYDLDRHSEDLDFDSNKRMNLENRIHTAIQGKFSIDAIKLLKDTGTVQRVRVLYSDNATGTKGSLKIETSFRSHPKKEEITIKNGIKVYKIEKYEKSYENQKHSHHFSQVNGGKIFFLNHREEKKWKVFSRSFRRKDSKDCLEN